MPWMLSRPVESHLWKPLAENPLPFAGLASSLTGEFDYPANIDGDLPASLRGTLYRNGPGLFERGNCRKRMLLDGDGMIQALQVRQGTARYRNRYVRTSKFVEESKAGNFLYPTWSTLAPDNFMVNLGGNLANQAGVTVCRWGEKLYAFDENHRPYLLDPERLDTLGEAILDPDHADAGYLAHWKIDRQRNEFLHLSLVYGRRATARVTVLDNRGRIKARHCFSLPRSVYMHDWLVSDGHFVFVMHPAVISLSGLVSVLLGRRCYADIVGWRPEQGNLIAIASREPGQSEVQCFAAEPMWMWHGLNAFEQSGELVVDFVGSASAGGLGAEDSPLFTLMKGQPPHLDAEPFTQIRRYRVSLSQNHLREETLAREMSYEMPYVNPQLACHAHRYGYFAAARPGELFWSVVVRLDTRQGKTEAFDFGPGIYVSEPVFAPKPGITYSAEGPEPGWVLTQGYDSFAKRSFVAVLESEHLTDGPVARVQLSHHVPLSFHGQWVSEE